jgi:hypothetical protein
MDKEVTSKRASRTIEITNERYEAIEESIDIAIIGRAILKDAVKKDEVTNIILDVPGMPKTFKRTVGTRGENVFATLNRLNIREHEVDFIIVNRTVTRSIESESSETKGSTLIHSKHEI